MAGIQLAIFLCRKYHLNNTLNKTNMDIEIVRSRFIKQFDGKKEVSILLQDV